MTTKKRAKNLTNQLKNLNNEPKNLPEKVRRFRKCPYCRTGFGELIWYPEYKCLKCCKTFRVED